MARPREYDDSTRTRILEVAGQVLGGVGPGALTVRRLASEVDASTSVIYSLFGSKVGVIRAMYREGFQSLADHLAAVDVDLPPIQRLHNLARAYRAAARAHPHLYDVMFACPVPEFVPSDEDHELAISTLHQLGQAVTDAVEQGVINGDPTVVTFSLWSVVHGLASLELSGSLDMESTADDVWQTTVGAALAGLSEPSP